MSAKNIPGKLESKAHDNKRVGDRPILGRKSVLMGMLASGFVIANAAQAPAASAGTLKPAVLAGPVYVPKWTSSTAYTVGQQVTSPNNDVVSANVAHTSSTAFATDTAKWALSSTYTQVKESPPSLPRYWQPGDVDWTAAFGRVFAAGITKAYVPPSSVPYGISKGLVMPASMSLHLDRGATVIATAPIAGPMLTVGNILSGLSNRWRDKTLTGGTWECNNLAQNGIYIQHHLNVEVSRLVVRNAKSHSVMIGNPSQPEQSNECRISNVKIDRNDSGAGSSVPVGSYGIWLRYVCDSWVNHCIVVGADTSFRNDGSANRFVQCHGWGWTSQLPSVIFDDNGYDSDYIACAADTPSMYGFRMRANSWRIHGGSVFNGDLGADNVIIGIHSEQSSPNASVIGVAFNGITTRRILTDFDGPFPNDNLTASGNTSDNTTNQHLSGIESLRSVKTSGYIQPQANNGGAKIFSGNGNPNTYVGGTLGDWFIRSDSPGTSLARLYVCKGGTTWTGIL